MYSAGCFSARRIWRHGRRRYLNQDFLDYRMDRMNEDEAAAARQLHWMIAHPAIPRIPIQTIYVIIRMSVL